MSTFFVVHSDGDIEEFDEKQDAERAADGYDAVIICGRMLNAKVEEDSNPLFEASVSTPFGEASVSLDGTAPYFDYQIKE